MNNPSPLESIFFRALERPSTTERMAFLDEVCADDHELRLHVERMLAAQLLAGGFLESSPSDLDVSQFKLHVTERPGSIVGPYKLLEQIGEGGFGVVFLAEQQQPMRRRVALKIIKPGMDTHEVIARFAAERQALALMDHRHIAKVLDAGTTDIGRPYFVMELVHGVPITEYCDQCNLSMRERLELFVAVCQAVQHAHQKGIIHRDLKPTNVLVTIEDGKPAPKVIDFGVAKAVNQQLTEHSLQTAFTQMIGTPLYMSPEQAELSPLGIDTRSDIYSLGVLLYELLTGSTPFETERLKAAAFDEMRRIIREEEPPRPSARVSTLGPQAETVAVNRRTDTKKLCQQMRGDLDWIVMKALEKDRNRRYETASGLQQDIERYLRDEPVQACPPSKMYRCRKFARRYRVPLAIAAAFMILLLLGAVASTWQAIRATHAEQHASIDRDAKEQALREAVASAHRADAVSKFLVDAFRSTDPNVDGRTVTIAQVLDRAAKVVQGKSTDDPRTRATLLDAIGQSYEGLGLDREAVPLYEAAYALRKDRADVDIRDTIELQMRLAAAYGATGRRHEELKLDEEILELATSKLGPNHLATLNAMGNLALDYKRLGAFDEALALQEKTLELKRANLGPDDPDTLTTSRNVANAYLRAGRLQEGRLLLEQTLERQKANLRPEHTSTLSTTQDLADGYLRLGRYDDAIPLLKTKLDAARRRLGPHEPGTLKAMNSLTDAYREAGQLDEALALAKETRELCKAHLDPTRSINLESITLLATVYRDAGRMDLALPLYEEAYHIAKAVPEHGDTMAVTMNLGQAYDSADRPKEALPLLKEVFEFKSKSRADDQETLDSENDLGMAYLRAGQLDEARPLLEETLNLRKTVLGPVHPDTIASMTNLAAVYRPMGHVDEAIALGEEAVKLAKANLGPNRNIALDSMDTLAVAYRDAGRFAEAVQLHEEALQLSKVQRGATHPLTLLMMEDLADEYVCVGRLNDAAPLLEEALRLATVRVGPDHRDTIDIKSTLGFVLIKQGKHVAAETLLKDDLPSVRAHLPPDDLLLADWVAHLGFALVSQNKFAEAEPLARECLEIRAKKIPQHWTTFSARSFLGGALLGQKKYAEAEPLLVSGYEGLREREANIPAPSKQALPKAVERLVQLYEATNQQDKAAEWKSKLTDIDKAESNKSAPATNN